MPIDANATSEFFKNPQKFLKKNQVAIQGKSKNNLKTVYKGLNDANLRNKFFNMTDMRNLAANDSNIKITDADILTVDTHGLEGPTCYMHLEKHSYIKGGYYSAVVDIKQESGAQLINYLPYRQNQLTAMKIAKDPSKPTIAMTDSLTGCNVYVVEMASETYMIHTNAISLKWDDEIDDLKLPKNGVKIGYMRDLLSKFIKGAGNTIKLTFESLEYNFHRERVYELWKNDYKVDQEKGKVDAIDTCECIGFLNKQMEWEFYSSMRTKAKAKDKHNAFKQADVLIKFDFLG